MSADPATPPTQTRADRRAAIATGIFFIIATAFLFVGEAFYKPVLSAPDLAESIAMQKPRFVLGVVVEFLCVIAMPMIAVAIYPVLKRVNESVALAYVVFRTLEAIIIITVAQINTLALIALVGELPELPAPEAADLDTILAGYAAQSAFGGTAGALYNLIFVIGALILYVALFRSRLIPRWISVWGILAILTLAGAVVTSFAVEVTGIWLVVLLLPIGVQEMVMALWFIFKGFDPDALSRLPQRV